MNAKPLYQCYYCAKIHEDDRDAINCCGVNAVVYTCFACTRQYPLLEASIQCCGSSKYTMLYQCSNCKETFEDAHQAMYCCTEDTSC